VKKERKKRKKKAGMERQECDAGWYG